MQKNPLQLKKKISFLSFHSIQMFVQTMPLFQSFRGLFRSSTLFLPKRQTDISHKGRNFY